MVPDSALHIHIDSVALFACSAIREASNIDAVINLRANDKIATSLALHNRIWEGDGTGSLGEASLEEAAAVVQNQRTRLIDHHPNNRQKKMSGRKKHNKKKAGGASGGGIQQADPRPKSSLETVSAVVDLEDVFKGSEKTVTIERKLGCIACAGKGGVHQIKCSECRGRGQVQGLRMLGPFVQEVTQTCSECSGQGRVLDPRNLCGPCGGQGYHLESADIKFKVPVGAKESTKVTVANAGHLEAGRRPGDVAVVLRIQRHAVFQRIEQHLCIKQTVSVTQALCGAKLSIQHLDGSYLSIRSPPGMVLRPGSQMMVSGEGMPVPGAPRGNLYINFDVDLSMSYDALSPEVSKLLRVLLPVTKPEHVAPAHAETVALVEKDIDVRKFFVSRKSSRDDDRDDHDGPQCAHQ
eukprot:m.33785 g.33785  ORF g.33785 m.33785 type:complete len:408 (-) comp9491_c0_seq2:21-1244(-)